MPRYEISVVSDEFSADGDRDFPEAEAARKEAIPGAGTMGVEQLCAVADLFGPKFR